MVALAVSAHRQIHRDDQCLVIGRQGAANQAKEKVLVFQGIGLKPKPPLNGFGNALHGCRGRAGQDVGYAGSHRGLGNGHICAWIAIPQCAGRGRGHGHGDAATKHLSLGVDDRHIAQHLGPETQILKCLAVGAQGHFIFCTAIEKIIQSAWQTALGRQTQVFNRVGRCQPRTPGFKPPQEQ